MKTLLFLDHSPVIGGAQLVLLNYLKYFDKSKFKIIVVCGHTNEKLLKEYERYADKVYVISFGRLKVKSIRALYELGTTLRDLLHIIRKENIDIIVTNTERAMYGGTLAAIVTKKPLYWFVRDFCYNKKLFKKLSKYPKKIYYVSENIRKYYGVEATNEVIYVSSDMHEKINSVTAKELDDFKDFYKLNNKFVVGYVGRLANWKGINVLLKAMSLIKDKNIKCIIAGDLESAEISSEFNGSLPENVVMTGFIMGIETVYKALDVFIHPSIEPEPYATSIVEAMMAGVPVIATDLGGTSEIVEPGITGLLIKGNSVEDLAAAIIKLYDNDQLRIDLGKDAYTKVMKHNLISAEIQKLEKEFLSV